jgi:hypothetical protein
MNSIARYKNQEVEIHDRYTIGGVEYAAVKAIEGKPFMGGDRFPVKSAWATAKVDELEKCLSPDIPQPKQDNLLNLALAQERPQWINGEAVTIWENGHRSAILKNFGGFVDLCLSDYPKGVTVFWLDPRKGWTVNAKVGQEYRLWAASVKAAQEASMLKHGGKV